MSLSYAGSTRHISNLANIETELDSLAADMQRLHEIARLQPAEVIRFVHLEHAVNTRLECLAEALARQAPVAMM